MRKTEHTARVTRGIGQALTSLLLLLYIAASSNVEWLHTVVHDHNIAVTHSNEDEQDPCHRLLYHSDVEQGCGHDSHLIVTDKCSMCDLAFHGDQIFLKTLCYKSGIPFQEERHSLYKSNLDSYWAVISSSRAPPALI